MHDVDGTLCERQNGILTVKERKRGYEVLFAAGSTYTHTRNVKETQGHPLRVLLRSPGIGVQNIASVSVRAVHTRHTGVLFLIVVI